MRSLLYRATIINQALVDREGSSYYYLLLTPCVSLPHHCNQRSSTVCQCAFFFDWSVATLRPTEI